ncbi:hypothetical protein Syun_010883 [Stephania yunnanensis]|uniref:Uncharacterized protein n=1 Tax=Stephania yunnanensis TaxID=152371 RepID=A0AAP0JXU2_9MAGN
MKSLYQITLLFLFMIVVINGASINLVQAGRTFPGDVLMINQIIDGENFVVEMIRNYITKGKPYVPPLRKEIRSRANRFFVDLLLLLRKTLLICLLNLSYIDHFPLL